MAEEDVTTRGPLFEADVDDIIERANRNAGKDIADALLEKWRGLLESRMRDSHGNYISGLTVSEGGDNEPWRVHDDITYVYGPWLEGKGSRNKTTRFGGYHSLEDAYAAMESEAGDILERHVRELVTELGG